MCQSKSLYFILPSLKDHMFLLYNTVLSCGWHTASHCPSLAGSPAARQGIRGLPDRELRLMRNTETKLVKNISYSNEKPAKSYLGLACICKANINIKVTKPDGLTHWRKPVQRVLGFFFLFVQWTGQTPPLFNKQKNCDSILAKMINFLFAFCYSLFLPNEQINGVRLKV